MQYNNNILVSIEGNIGSGKSTLLRSTCAVALLGACGLAVPAGSNTTIPYIDAFMLRNFSADSPIEGRSSFAVEMTEMKYVLQDATASSLVLMDELGKGTEATAGSALAGAMLEALDAVGCLGAFATHLHLLLDMQLRLPNTQQMMMEIEDFDGVREGEGTVKKASRRRPTWRVVPGASTESLALEVAAACQLPEDLLNRAENLYAHLLVPGSTRGDTGGTFLDCKEFNAQNGSDSSGTTSTAFVEGASRGASKELLQAGSVLERTCRTILSGLEGKEYSEESFIEVQFVPSGLIPPARTVGASCIYIARRLSDGRFYVGEWLNSSSNKNNRTKPCIYLLVLMIKFPILLKLVCIIGCINNPKP